MAANTATSAYTGTCGDVRRRVVFGHHRRPLVHAENHHRRKRNGLLQARDGDCPMLRLPPSSGGPLSGSFNFKAPADACRCPCRDRPRRGCCHRRVRVHRRRVIECLTGGSHHAKPTRSGVCDSTVARCGHPHSVTSAVGGPATSSDSHAIAPTGGCVHTAAAIADARPAIATGATTFGGRPDGVITVEGEDPGGKRGAGKKGGGARAGGACGAMRCARTLGCPAYGCMAAYRMGTLKTAGRARLDGAGPGGALLWEERGKAAEGMKEGRSRMGGGRRRAAAAAYASEAAGRRGGEGGLLRLVFGGGRARGKEVGRCRSAPPRGTDGLCDISFPPEPVRGV